MSQDTEEFVEAADKRAKMVVAISGGLLLLLPGFINNFELPHDFFWLIAVTAGFGAFSLLFATLAFLIADANRRRIALDSREDSDKNKKWSSYHKAYGISIFSFSAAVITFAAFAIINSSDFMQPSLKTIDIVLDKPVVGPEETIVLKAEFDTAVRPDAFKWSASDGLFFDDNQRTVTWLSPSGLEESNWIDISVSVNVDGVAITESTRILFISPIVDNANEEKNAVQLTTLFSNIVNANEVNKFDFKRGGRNVLYGVNCNPSLNLLHMIHSDVSSNVDAEAELKIFGPRKCCSESEKPWPLCDSEC